MGWESRALLWPSLQSPPTPSVLYVSPSLLLFFSLFSIPFVLCYCFFFVCFADRSYIVAYTNTQGG